MEDLGDVRSDVGRVGRAYVTMWLDMEAMPHRLLEVGGAGTGAPKSPQASLQMPRLPGVTCPKQGYEGVLSLAESLRRVGAAYPLVLLTNDKRLLDPAVADSHPNLVVTPVRDADYVNRSCAASSRLGALLFQKLMMFSLTQYSRLLWLDTDFAIRSNVDHVFDYNLRGGTTIYAHSNVCKSARGSQLGEQVCSGAMLFQPSHTMAHAVMEAARNMSKCWSDQPVIIEAFWGMEGFRAGGNLERGRGPWKPMMLPDVDVSIALCKERNSSKLVHLWDDHWCTGGGDFEPY